MQKKVFFKVIVNFPLQTQRIIFDIYNWLQFLVILRRKSISMENNIFLYLYTNAQMTDLDWLWLLIFNEQWAAYISFAPSYIRKFMLRIFGYWHIGSKVASTNSTESPSNIEGVTGFSVMLQNLDLYIYFLIDSVYVFWQVVLLSHWIHSVHHFVSIKSIIMLKYRSKWLISLTATFINFSPPYNV